MAETINALDLKITAKDDFSAVLDKFQKSLEQVNSKGKSFKKTATEIDEAMKLIKESTSLVNVSLSKAEKNISKAGKASSQSSKNIKNLGNESKTSANKVNSLSINLKSLSSTLVNVTAKALAFVGGMNGIANTISSAISNSVEYTETLNLFNVTLDEYANNAQRYAENVSNLMGIDPSEFMRYQGTFDSIIKGFGVGAEQAAYMSQQLTQLGYDISSFFNLDVDQAMLKIQSGVAGEIEPMRRIGYDLSQSRLTMIAQNPSNYGTTTYRVNEATGALEGYTSALDDNTQAVVANFSELSQMDKVQLRYIAMMTEQSYVQGDFARTLKDPANQIRVLRSQLQMCSRELGNIFVPAINSLLPYLIAMAQVVKEILRSVALLFGYEIPDMSDRLGVGGVVSGYEDIADEMDKAAGSAKKLRDYTIGIDELNVLRPNDGGSGSGNNNNYASGGSYLTPGYDFIGEATNRRVEEIKRQIEDIITSFKDGSRSIGDFIADMFNRLVSLWNNPFLDGSKFGQAIENGIREANVFLKNSNTMLLGYKIGEWLKGTITGSDVVYEATRFVINFADSLIRFNSGFLAGVDIVRTTDSILKQITDALLADFSDDLFGGHFEGNDFVVTNDRLILEFNTAEYALKHPIIATLGDWVATVLGIGDRYDRNGNYIEANIPIRIRLQTLFEGMGGLTGIALNSGNTNPFNYMLGATSIALNFSEEARQFISDFVDTIVRTATNFLDAIDGVFGINTGRAVRRLENLSDSVSEWANSGQSQNQNSQSSNRNVGFNNLVRNLGNLTSRIKDKGKHGASAYVSGFEEEINQSKGVIENLGISLSNSISKPFGNLGLRIGDDFGKGLSVGIDSSKGVVDGSVNNLKNGAIASLRSELYNKMYEAGQNGVSGFAKALSDSPAVKQAINNAKSMASSAVNAVKQELQIHSPSKVMNEVGQQFASGMSSGIKESVPTVNKDVATTTKQTIKNITSTAKQTVKQQLKIKSPSREFMELGAYTAEGFTIGFEKEAQNTYKALSDFSNTIKNVDTTSVYNPMNYSVAIPTLSNGSTRGSVEGMANVSSVVYEAITTALQTVPNGNSNQGDTKIYINGREVFKVVQEEARRNGVTISNGAFVGG